MKGQATCRSTMVTWADAGCPERTIDRVAVWPLSGPIRSSTSRRRRTGCPSQAAVLTINLNFVGNFHVRELAAERPLVRLVPVPTDTLAASGKALGKVDLAIASR